MKHVLLPFMVFFTITLAYPQTKINPDLNLQRCSVNPTLQKGPDHLKPDPVQKKSLSVAKTIVNGTEKGIVNCTSVGTSANARTNGYSGGQRSILTCNNAINTVVHIHRQGGYLDPDGYSGDLSVDVSTDGGQTFITQTEIYLAENNAGGINYADAARLPQCGIYNPQGNTIADNALVTFMAPTLDGSNSTGGDGWGGLALGSFSIDNPSNATKTLLTSSTPYGIYHNIPDGFCVTSTGDVWGVDVGLDRTSSSVIYTGLLTVTYGIWDSIANDYSYIDFPIACPIAEDLLKPGMVKIEFSPDGQTGYIVVLTNNGCNLAGEDVYYPVVYKSTNGGASWSYPSPVVLGGQNGIPAIKNYITDEQWQTLWSQPYPGRDDVSYSCAFDFDLTVDVNGNPHIAVGVGVADESNPYSIITSDPYYVITDIWSPDGGISWDAYIIDRPNTFRSNFWADYTDDNRVQIARSHSGEHVFVSYMDTHVENADYNNYPDIMCRGIDVNATSMTMVMGTLLFEDRSFNVTSGSVANEQAYFMVMANEVLENDSAFIIPFTYMNLDITDPEAPVEHMYISDFGISKEGCYFSAGEPDIAVFPDTLNFVEGNSPAKSAMVKSCPQKPSINMKGSEKQRYVKPPVEYIVDTLITQSNQIIIDVVEPGRPPDNYTPTKAEISKNAVMLSNVPAFSWCFGCSPTAAAMLAGYYDNMGYPNVYTGPTNGGVMPMDNSCWGTKKINGDYRALCPLSATMYQLDGRDRKGHVDDYWVKVCTGEPDPYIGNWPEHAWGDCLADYMQTNQQKFNNGDGGTKFRYNDDGSRLEDPPFGWGGVKLFFESRGYNVLVHFNQTIVGYNGNTQGFSFGEYMNEIDAGRPVNLHLIGHSMLGVGYDASDSTIYFHNTWDFYVHSMKWGGIYSGMDHYSVSVIELEPNSFTCDTLITIANNGSDNIAIHSISSDPWIEISGVPKSQFYLVAGSSQTVEVSVAWEQIGCFPASGSIIIDSDDPDENVITIPVSALPVDSTELWIQNPDFSPISASPGDTAIISYDVLNMGRNIDSSFVSKCFLSSDYVVDDNDLCVAIDTILSLVSGEQISFFDTIFIPDTISPDHKFILYVVDADSAIAEDVEDNNMVYRYLPSFFPPPNLYYAWPLPGNIVYLRWAPLAKKQNNYAGAGAKEDIFTGYNLYRNDTLIVSLPIETQWYYDEVSPGGIHKYNLTAVYEPEYESLREAAEAIANVGFEFDSPDDIQTNASFNQMDVLVSWCPPEGLFEDYWVSYWAPYYYPILLGPERNTYFDANYFGVEYPAEISKLAHSFIEKSTTPWGDDDTFVYKIYDVDSSTLLYESPVLIAEKDSLIIWELENPLVVYNDFYCCVAPTNSETGNPASVARQEIGYESHSYTGTAGNWTPYRMDFDIRVRIESQTSLCKTPLDPKDNGNKNIAIEHAITGYNLWRDGELVSYIPALDTSYLDENLDAGNYVYAVSAIYNRGESPVVESDTATVIEFPEGWAYVETGLTHVFNIDPAAPSINGDSLEYGSWIGAFYKDNGVEKCAGFLHWQGIDSPAITLYGDNPATTDKDGFNENEIISWKFFNQNLTPQEYEARAVVNYGPEIFNADSVSNIISLKEWINLEHSLLLSEGWSGISTYVTPINDATEDIFNPVVNDLVILKNLTSVYWPPINQIEHWNSYEGYKLKMQDADTIIFVGSETQKEITLPKGWSMLPVLTNQNVEVISFFAPVVDDLIIVKSIDGSGLYWPSVGVQTLQYIVPGKSYQIKLANEASVSFPQLVTSKVSNLTGYEMAPSCEHWNIPVNTGNTHTIVLKDNSLNHFLKGDFIGAFDKDGRCVGCNRYLGGDQLPISVYGDDPYTVEKDGLVLNDPIILKVFSNGKEYDICNWTANKNYNQKFRNDGLTVIDDIFLRSNEYQGSGPSNVKVYPVPSCKYITIEIPSIEDKYSIEVISIAGETLLSEHTTQEVKRLNISGLLPGLYFLKVENSLGVIYHIHRIVKL